MNRRRAIFKVAVGCLVGAGCLWLALRKVSLSEVMVALHGFDWRYLIAAVAVSLTIQVFRAWRWQIELTPLRPLPFALLWQVVSVAYMMINVLPFRLGEPVRPILLSWKTGLPIPAIVGNWVFEKMMDAAAMVLIIHLTLMMADLPTWAHRASGVSLGSFLVLLALVVAVWLRGEQFFDATLARLLPAHARAGTRRILLGARDGLQILPDRRLVSIVFLVTLAMWMLPIFSSWLLLKGFGLDLPIAAPFVIFVCIGLGTALPNPPGMFGVFQIAAVVALGLFDVPEAQAVAYGIVLNAVQFFTLVAQGLVALSLAGVGIGALTRAAVEEGQSATTCQSQSG